MIYKLFACEILFREISYLVSQSIHRVDVVFLPKGLHDIGRKSMFARLQEAFLDVDESRYDAILFAYGLCNGGIVGLRAREIPLVFPRAHDCMTLFLGDRNRYQEYFEANSATYFQTSGWLERGSDLSQFPIDGARGFEELREKYGEENAKYIYEKLTRMVHYDKIAFIETGIEPNDQFKQQARKLSESRSWNFETIPGDLSLLKTLLDGPWNDRNFLVLQPGQSLDFDYTGNILKSKD